MYHRHLFTTFLSLYFLLLSNYITYYIYIFFFSISFSSTTSNNMGCACIFNVSIFIPRCTKLNPSPLSYSRLAFRPCYSNDLFTLKSALTKSPTKNQPIWQSLSSYFKLNCSLILMIYFSLLD